MTATPAAPAAVRAELLDCMQANLAVLADGSHGPRTHLRLGAVLRLDPRPEATGLPTVEPTLTDQLAAARTLLGLGTDDLARDRPTAGVLAALADGRTRYVVADAHDLPWTPYHGRRHLEHSLLLRADGGGGVEITDAYHNDTPWGRARPARWTLTTAAAAAALPPVLNAVTAPEVVPLGPVPPPGPGSDPAAVEAYLAPYRGRGDAGTLDRLCLQTWLLTRSRALHAAFLAAGDELPPAATAHLDRWRAVSEQAYVALRRAERGRPAPAGVLDAVAELLHRDAAVLTRADAAGRIAPVTRVAATGSREADPMWPQFAGVVGTVLGTSAAELSRVGSLAEIRSCSSLRLVEVIEALEHTFGVRFGPADLAPDRLHDLDHLLALSRPAAAAAVLEEPAR